MNKPIFTLSAALMLLAAIPAQARIEHLMPTPKVVNRTVDGAQAFTLGRAVRLTDPTSCEWLGKTLGELGLTVADDAQATVTVNIVDAIEGAFNHNIPDYPHEAYRLSVSGDNITITALTKTGVIRAAQTLAQLALEGDNAIEAADITDWPAFKVRGFMHDVGRSFLSMDELKQEIDLLSRFKINTFHWHLTDYTGWRMEIKAYPQLTGDASITRFPGCYYTQEDAVELQNYAAERGMTIIPEIDMPGHSHPFENAMGHSMLTDEGKAELKVILNEVCTLFDKAPYIHIGGDEISFDDSFLVEMIAHVHGLGKKVVIWNKYNRPAKAIDLNTIKADMCTNWATSGTLTTGLPNIDMRYNYTNHFDVFADLVGIFKSSIFYQAQGNDDVAGTISAAWSDTMTPTEKDIVRQNNVYANVLASGERAWCGGGEQYIETGGTVLPNSGSEYEAFADWERRFLFHKNTTMAAAKEKIPYVRQTNVRWYVTEQIPNGGDASKTLAPEQYLNADKMPTEFDVDGNTYGVTTMTGAGIYLRHIWHGTVKGNYANPQNNMTAYAWTEVYSPVEQDAGAYIEFYTYSRSGNEKGPDAGKWDRRGSRIWLNGEEIPAPEWVQPGANIRQDQNDSGLQNENFTARPVTPIHLKEGWNRVFMKLPHANNGGTGRDKWQFTFVVTDTEGHDALDGLVYSPGKCMTAEDEQLNALIMEVRGYIRTNFGELPGYLAVTPEAEALIAYLDTVEATLGDNVTADERAAQISRITDEYNALKSSGELVSPAEKTFYYLHSSRGTRYLTSNGIGTGLTGEATQSASAAWQFVARPDGTYDIQNYSDKSYISPTAANNSQLQTVADAPATGWTIKPAANVPWVIVTASNGAQFNQTNAGLGYKVYNWGSGTNTTDDGCQYRFLMSEYRPVDGIVQPADSTEPLKIFTAPGSILVEGCPVEVYNLQGIRVAHGTGTLPVPSGVVIVKTPVQTLRLAIP